jgi:isoaspartyl peptidase/L-asparaginase-like protein (Ntn-hydrolase superfamily)
VYAFHLFESVPTMPLHSQYFIRLSTASTLARLMQHSHKSVKEAAESVVKELRNNGGLGGVVALDEAGNGMGSSIYSSRM